MIDVNRKSYPYMEEVNDGILHEFERLAPETGRVLDVGCGRGQLGEAIRSLGWSVWGVEDAVAAHAAARERLDGLVEADLHDLGRVRGQLGPSSFDALVFSDVLEHLYDPRTVLENYLEFVRPGGRVLISVPNAVVWTNRLRLLVGRVDYTDTGVMDRTHIRFFTFRTARQLVEASGCRVDRVASTPYLARAILPLLKRRLARDDGAAADPRALIDSPSYQTYLKYVYPAERTVASLWRRMLAFRIIVVGIKLAP